MSEIWFTSDQHYGHENIIKFCNRPFQNTEEMKETLIENHNKVVKPGDRVYHLGDIFWRTTSDNEALEILTRLQGEHYYIRGNHEEVLKRSKAVRDSFIWIRDTENLSVGNYPKIWLAHYAHRVWNGSHKGAYHLFGHTHAELPNVGSLSFDVGVDAQNFSPISLEQVHQKMLKIADKFKGKCFVCKCGNKFVSFHNRPTICSKCGGEMELK